MGGGFGQGVFPKKNFRGYFGDFGHLRRLKCLVSVIKGCEGSICRRFQ